MPTLGEAENLEFRDFNRRFWWSLPLTLIVTLHAMTGHSLQLFHGSVQNWAELGLATPVTLWAGWPFFIRAMTSVSNRSPNMWTLIGLGTAAAYLYSVAATLFPQRFPSNFMQDGRIGVYFEAAAVIISLTLLGQVLELKARSQTSAAIKSLLGLSPKTARRINAGGLEGVVCGRGRNPTLRLWPTIFSGKIDVFPGDRRSRLISSMTSVAPA